MSLPLRIRTPESNGAPPPPEDEGAEGLLKRWKKSTIVVLVVAAVGLLGFLQKAIDEFGKVADAFTPHLEISGALGADYNAMNAKITFTNKGHDPIDVVNMTCGLSEVARKDGRVLRPSVYVRDISKQIRKIYPNIPETRTCDDLYGFFFGNPARYPAYFFIRIDVRVPTIYPVYTRTLKRMVEADVDPEGRVVFKPAYPWDFAD